VITIDQMRDLMQTVHLKPLEAEYKVAVIAAADRLNAQAANAFLKTLEEPPQKSVLILLSTDPQQILETILSRCLRLDFAGENTLGLNADQMAWLISFTDLAADEQIGILGRYRLLGILQKKLAQTKSDIESTLAARSPLERYEDADPSLRAKWEEELAAAIEAEYRRQRTDLLRVLLYWLRDVWLQTLAVAGARLLFPQLASRTQKCAQRLSTNQAMENLEVLERTQRLLESNVQEALALEVGLLKLSL
jgi:DNA polymerase-3 subunit delta'